MDSDAAGVSLILGNVSKTIVKRQMNTPEAAALVAAAGGIDTGAATGSADPGPGPADGSPPGAAAGSGDPGPADGSPASIKLGSLSLKKQKRHAGSGPSTSGTPGGAAVPIPVVDAREVLYETAATTILEMPEDGPVKASLYAILVHIGAILMQMDEHGEIQLRMSQDFTVPTVLCPFSPNVNDTVQSVIGCIVCRAKLVHQALKVYIPAEIAKSIGNPDGYVALCASCHKRCVDAGDGWLDGSVRGLPSPVRVAIVSQPVPAVMQVIVDKLVAMKWCKVLHPLEPPQVVDPPAVPASISRRALEDLLLDVASVGGLKRNQEPVDRKKAGRFTW